MTNLLLITLSALLGALLILYQISRTAKTLKVWQSEKIKEALKRNIDVAEREKK